MAQHQTSNVEAAIVTGTHTFVVAPGGEKVVIQGAIAPHSGAMGVLNLLNAAGTVFFSCGVSGQGSTQTLPAGTYRWQVVGGTNIAAGASGWMVIVYNI